jgi:hypothetical protein
MTCHSEPVEGLFIKRFDKLNVTGFSMVVISTDFLKKIDANIIRTYSELNNNK